MLALVTAFSRREKEVERATSQLEAVSFGGFVCFLEKVLTRYAAVSLCEMWGRVWIPYMYWKGHIGFLVLFCKGH